MPVLIRSPKADYDATNAMRVPIYADIPAAADIPGAGVPLKLTPAGWVPAAAGDTVRAWSSRAATANNSGPFAEPVTAYGAGVRFHYSDTPLEPGTDLYLTANPGELSTDANGEPVAYALTTRDIVGKAF